MLTAVFLALVMGIPMVLLAVAHYAFYDTFNGLAVSLMAFLVINLHICIWELALYYRFDVIEDIHKKRTKLGFYKRDSEGAKVREKNPIIVFLDVPLATLLQFKTWAIIWIDYARYDISYTDPTTFAYCIDVGNGHSTLLPAILVLWSIISPIWSARVTGIIGVILFYQKMYGTYVYLFAFFNNGRHKVCSAKELIFCVLMTNLTWVVFPLMGIYACVDMIMTDSFAILQ